MSAPEIRSAAPQLRSVFVRWNCCIFVLVLTGWKALFALIQAVNTSSVSAGSPGADNTERKPAAGCSLTQLCVLESDSGFKETDPRSSSQHRQKPRR